MAQVLTEYDGRVRLIFKDRPLASHGLARSAHEAARCAGAEGKYWEYHELLFEEQPRFERAELLEYAADVGLDRAAFARCLDERRFAGAVETDVREARALGVTGTPTLLVNGRMVVGAIPVAELRAVVEDALKGRR